MKIVFVYEKFFSPFDEGVKVFCRQLVDYISAEHAVTLVRDYARRENLPDKLLMVIRVIVIGLRVRPAWIIYVPYASLTFSTYIRIAILRAIFGEKLIVLGTQKRTLRAWQMKIVRRLRIDRLHVLSLAMGEALEDLGIDAIQVNAGLDNERFRPVADKRALREKYGVPQDRTVLLHVGHIRESRNVRWLLDVQRKMPELVVITVGSTSTDRDDAMRQELSDGGLILFTDYVAEIQELYQLSDVYCFPVLKSDAAMELPLSVLEAMATNLPILTTRFGRLPEQFEEDNGYHYIASSEDIVRQLRDGFGSGTECGNRDKIQRYTWRAVVENLIIG